MLELLKFLALPKTIFLVYENLDNIEIYSKQDMSGKDRMLFIVNKSI